MAGQDRIAADPVAAFDLLAREPHRFSLFAALRLVELSERGRARLGETRRPADERVRLEQPPHLFFAPSDVAAVEHRAGRLRLEQFGFGVFGPNGALPFHLTEYAFERRRHHEDAAVSDFVNLFQHRMIGLFYRAWADSDPVAGYSGLTTDRFARFVGALIGLPGPSAFGRDALPDPARLCRAGLLSPSNRSADGLAASLSDYFGLKIRVRQFVAGWLRVPVGSRTRLGARQPGSMLGAGATLGAASWQCQNRFEVLIGPLAFEEFLGFLPGSRAMRELAAMIRFYTTGEWSWQVRLLVRKGDAPGVSLGRIGRLGWTSWLGRKTGIAADVVLQDGEAVTA